MFQRLQRISSIIIIMATIVFFINLSLLYVVGDYEQGVLTCTPYNFNKQKISESIWVFEWETEDSCSGYLKVGTDYDSIETVIFPRESDSKRKSHSVELVGSEYLYVLVVSEGKVFSDNGLPMVLL